MERANVLPFFDKAQVKRWCQVSGKKTYDKNNTEHQKIGQDARELYQQVAYWGQLITEDIPCLQVTGRQKWNFGANFRPYLWLQLRQKNIVNAPLFFTIELNNYDNVNFDRCLLMKIDIQWGGSKHTMPKEKMDKFSNMVPEAARWHEFCISNYYGWSSLAAESVQFIKEFYVTYHTIAGKLEY